LFEEPASDPENVYTLTLDRDVISGAIWWFIPTKVLKGRSENHVCSLIAARKAFSDNHVVRSFV
jgi:hypothetical protein